MTNKAEVRSIRQFIYMNVPTLYSLYSQVFGGITDRIIEERLNQELTGDKQSALPIFASSESQATTAYRRMESVVLYDHMYNQLEQAIGDAIQKAEVLTPESAAQALIENPIIKVSGRAEVEDYVRYREILTNFNKMAGVIAYSGAISDPKWAKQLAELDEAIAKEDKPARRRVLERERTSLAKKPDEVASKPLQSPQLLTNLEYMASMINPSGYEILVTPSTAPNMGFRGILDREWLRSSSSLIRSLYGGQSEAPWTMVGMTTHVQGTYTKASPPNLEMRTRTVEDDVNFPMMLDANRQLFRTARFFERMFLESSTGFEVVLSPIAVYQEFKISVMQGTTETSS
jgi:hypothetical protein